MQSESWVAVIALGVTAVLLFAFLYAGIHDDSYTLGYIPSKYIFFTAAVLIAILSLALYIYIFYQDTDDHTGTKINAYYIVTLIGIFAISWVFFSFEPTPMQLLGMFTIITGLVLFTFF